MLMPSRVVKRNGNELRPAPGHRCHCLACRTGDIYVNQDDRGCDVKDNDKKIIGIFIVCLLIAIPASIAMVKMILLDYGGASFESITVSILAVIAIILWGARA